MSDMSLGSTGQGVPQTFRTASQILTNYDFYDVASGTGYITFYAAKTESGYSLSTFPYYSFTQTGLNQCLTNYTQVSDVAYTKLIDLDFDVYLNKPIVLRGIGIVNDTFRILDGVAGVTWGYTLVRVRKWDGVTETEIASSTGTAVGVDGALKFQIDTHNITIPETIIPAGQYLRLTVEFWGKQTSGNIGKAEICHDPIGRQSPIYGTDIAAMGAWNVDYPTTLKFFCPIKVS